MAAWASISAEAPSNQCLSAVLRYHPNVGRQVVLTLRATNRPRSATDLQLFVDKPIPLSIHFVHVNIKGFDKALLYNEPLKMGFELIDAIQVAKAPPTIEQRSVAAWAFIAGGRSKRDHPALDTATLGHPTSKAD